MKPTTLFTATALLLAAGDGTVIAGNGLPRARAAAHRTAAPARANLDWTRQVVATPQGGFRMGNPNAPVKLVEFGSMTCHVCRDFSAQSSPGLQNYVRSGKVSYELRNYIRDSYDLVASLLARCGGAGPYFKLTEQIFTQQNAFIARAQALAPAQVEAINAVPVPQRFVRMAGVLGLDRFVAMRGIPATKARACLTNQAEVDRLVAMTQAADKQYQLPGTPTFLINGKLVEATASWSALEPRLRAAIGR